MRIRSTFRRDSLGAALALAAIALTFLLAACGGNKTATTKPPAGGSAKGGLAAAQSALSTMAPDAKLLLVQTAQSVAVTDTPVWVYVFGSPKTDKTYLVYERAGQTMGAAEYGKAGLGKDEWAKVPAPDAWKIDSDAALQKAEEAGPVKSATDYGMGFLTYLPKSQEASSPTKPMTWYVSLRSGETTASVKVDVQSGEVVK